MFSPEEPRTAARPCEKVAEPSPAMQPLGTGRVAFLKSGAPGASAVAGAGPAGREAGEGEACAVAALGRSASESEACADRVSVCGAAEAAGASPSFSKPPVVEQELAIARASTAMTPMIVVTG